MKIKDIARSAALMLQADETVAAIDDGTPDPDADTLVKSVNMAASELDGDFPVLNESAVRSSGKLIPLSALGGRVTRVKSVRCRGAAVGFTFTSQGIGVPYDGEFSVVYACEREDGGMDDDITLGAGVDTTLAAYLAARNYCLITGRTDEAAIWDERYVEEAQKLRLAKRRSIPRRRWL